MPVLMAILAAFAAVVVIVATVGCLIAMSPRKSLETRAADGDLDAEFQLMQRTGRMS